jgi:hypothetical protein
MPEPDIRKGMPPVKLSREEFESRYRSEFIDPAFAIAGGKTTFVKIREKGSDADGWVKVKNRKHPAMYRVMDVLA